MRPSARDLGWAPHRMRGWRALLIALVALVASGACGGSDDDSGPGPDIGLGSPEDGGSDPADPSGSGEGGGVTGTDQVAFTTDPGTAYAEVEGERIEYESADSIAYTCEVGADRLQVNFQTADGQDLGISAGPDGDGWSGQFSFRAADGGTVQYSIVFAQNVGTLGVADGALSYDGTADRIEDSDVLNTEEVDVQLAINCASAGDGDDPVAEIDGEEYTFPFSGAQSVDCAASPSDIGITVNRLGDELQLSIDMRGGPDDWIGSVFIITPDGDFTATLSGAAEGLTIDGDTVTYEGPIETDSGDEVAASVSITCP